MNVGQGSEVRRGAGTGDYEVGVTNHSLNKYPALKLSKLPIRNMLKVALSACQCFHCATVLSEIHAPIAVNCPVAIRMGYVKTSKVPIIAG